MKLEFKNVTKQYGEVNAVNKVNCVMEKGIYGLLGVNGAGKTTLMRMLCTIVQPSEGQILWNGKDIWKLGGEYREVLGYLPQDFGYYPDLTVYDYMMYISSIKGLKMPFARKKVKQLLNQVGMEKFSKRKMKNLSGGMVRRVGIAQAMLNDPQILVLDEPTAGLDPNERIRFRNLISELSECPDPPCGPEGKLLPLCSTQQQALGEISAFVLPADGYCFHRQVRSLQNHLHVLQSQKVSVFQWILSIPKLLSFSSFTSYSI